MTHSHTIASASRSIVETLETRQFLTVNAGFDAAFGGGTVTLSFGGNFAQALRVGVLKDGRILATGWANATKDAPAVPVAALFNPNGTLSKSFDGDGKAFLPANLGNVAIDVTPLPDGNALVSYQNNIIKLKTDGTLDKTFGKNGVLENVNRPILKNNQIVAIRNIPGTVGYGLNTYDLNGKLVSASFATVSNMPAFLPDGRAYAFNNSDPRKLDIYDNRLMSITPGNSGSIELGNAVDAYLNTVGPFTDSFGNPTDTVPTVQYPAATTARDGGFIVEAYLDGRAGRLPAEQNNSGRYFTTLNIRVSPQGKVLSINEGRARRTSVGWTGIGNEFKYGGKFLFGAGEDVIVKSGREGDIFYGTARSGAAFYTAGVSLNPAPGQGNYFTVGRTVPIVGTITGTLFNDDNRNKKLDNGETVNAGKTVYLDQNNNGKLDNDEITVVTDGRGKYTFADVGPGQYRVSRVLPSGYNLTNSTTFTLKPGETKVFDVGSTNKPATLKDIVLA